MIDVIWVSSALDDLKKIKEYISRDSICGFHKYHAYTFPLVTQGYATGLCCRTNFSFKRVLEFDLDYFDVVVLWCEEH